MATIVTRDKGQQLSLPVASGIESNDLLIWGGQPCVALTDRGTATSGILNEATLKFDGCITVPVEGPVAPEDALYLDADGGELSTDDSGTFFGIALSTVLVSTTTACEVRLGGINPDAVS